MISFDRLTETQQSIAAHGDGPALVFAVAGAGKTTSMVHRIASLVERTGTDPSDILATSFNRDTVQDLQEALADLNVQGVDVRTLHSLGYSLVRRAEKDGVLRARTRNQDTSPSALASILARRALSRLARQRDVETDDLGLSADDLVDQVGAWKQALAYADPDAADLPEEARAHISTAEHENEDLVTLYGIYESLRASEGWITYDDMLLEGWEVLHRSPEIRSAAQNAYRYVLVDEFQDVSRVQYRMLDILTRRHRNYMAIGDDDQCIYEWRGATPSFILDFQDAYDADEYVIDNTFRVPLDAAALGTAVIAENERRRDKSLQPAQTGDGDARIVRTSGRQEEAEAIASEIADALESGRAPGEVAVLVRTYGQTPPIEQALVQNGLPYRIVGNVPFYRRREVQTLLQYLYWAVLERRRRTSGWFSTQKEAERYVDRFRRILKTPSRYVEHALIDRVCASVANRETSALDRLRAALSKMHDRTVERVEDFLHLCDALVGRLDRPGADTVEWLIDTLDYREHLRDRSAADEVGESRVRSAEALIDIARGTESATDVLDRIVDLAARQTEAGPDDAVDIRSIHRAKGAEWPVVIVPGCNDGTLPRRRRQSGDSSTGKSTDDEELDEARLEEERRLLYVAITRTRDTLRLTCDESEPLSPFLDDIGAADILQSARQVSGLADASPETLSDDDVARACCGAGRLAAVDIDLKPYLRSRWDDDRGRRQALLERLDTMDAAVEDARQAMSAYRSACDAHRAEIDARRERTGGATKSKIKELREAIGTAPLSAQNEAQDTYFPDDARFSFRWTDDETAVAVRWQDEPVGLLDPLGDTRMRPDTFYDVPWPDLVGRFESVGRGRRRLRITIDWAASLENVQQGEATSDTDAPEPPAPVTRRLASSEYARGHEVLREAAEPDGGAGRGE